MPPNGSTEALERPCAPGQKPTTSSRNGHPVPGGLERRRRRGLAVSTKTPTTSADRGFARGAPLEASRTAQATACRQGPRISPRNAHLRPWHVRPRGRLLHTAACPRPACQGKCHALAHFCTPGAFAQGLEEARHGLGHFSRLGAFGASASRPASTPGLDKKCHARHKFSPPEASRTRPRGRPRGRASRKNATLADISRDSGPSGTRPRGRP